MEQIIKDPFLSDEEKIDKLKTFERLMTENRRVRGRLHVAKGALFGRSKRQAAVAIADDDSSSSSSGGDSSGDDAEVAFYANETKMQKKKKKKNAKKPVCLVRSMCCCFHCAAACMQYTCLVVTGIGAIVVCFVIALMIKDFLVRLFA